MKTTPFSVLALAAFFMDCAIARPRQTRLTDDDTITVATRVTAFLIGDNGLPTIECWEVQREKKSSSGGFQALSLVKGGDIEGLDLLTWPALSPIWPPSDDEYNSKAEDLSAPSLYTVKKGLVGSVHRTSKTAATDDEDDTEIHVFSLENGDDWFYFEDSYTGSAKAAQCANKNTAIPLFTIQSLSSTVTEVLRIKFSEAPKHKVLHKGACIFSGLRPLETGRSNVDEDL